MAQTILPPFDDQVAYRDGNPYPHYARYRALDPIHITPRSPDEITDGVDVRLFRHADCLASLRDPRLGREFDALRKDGDSLARTSPGTFGQVARLFMLFRDPPVHTRLRGVANMAFTPRQVTRMRPHIEEIATSLADDLRAAGDDAELIGQFAFPLPMLVIAEMLGIPREDFRQFRAVANDIAAAIDVPVEGLEEFIGRVDASTAELIDYLRRLVARRRTDPQDDLLTSLVQAEAAEGRLNEDELIATMILLIVAGHETTVNLIGNGTLALLRHPDQWRALVDTPALSRNATEELLRYDAPVQFTGRVVQQAVEMGGRVIPAGSWVTMMLGSANRDEAVFEHPDRLDIRRDVGRIMSFGMGIHFCLGAPLARLEGEIAFGTLAREFPDLALATETPRWRPGAVFHGLQDLPLRLG